MKNKKESKPWRWWHVMILIIVINLSFIYALFLPTWIDEAGYIDPGVQLILTGKMVSINSPESLWGASNPGMPLMFAGWFKLFGFGKIQARLLFCGLHFSGVFFLFRWIRNQFNPGPTTLLLGIISSLILPSLANAIFFCRLECLALLLSAWFLDYSFSESINFFNKFFSPLLFGITIMLFGLHFIAFFSLAAIGIFLYKLNQRSFLRGAGLALGIIVGLLLIRLAYGYYGIWDTFVAARSAHYGKILPWVPKGLRCFIVTPDMLNILSLVFFGLFSSIYFSIKTSQRLWVPWVFALGIFLIIPPIMNIIGIYYSAYSWMVVLPLMLSFYLGVKGLQFWAQKILATFLVLILILYAYKLIVRMPAVIARSRLREQVVKKIEEKFPQGASIATDWGFYYEMVIKGYRIYPKERNVDGYSFGPEHYKNIPAEKRERISILVSTEDKVKEDIFGLGGEWQLYAIVPSNLKKEIQPDYQIFIRK